MTHIAVRGVSVAKEAVEERERVYCSRRKEERTGRRRRRRGVDIKKKKVESQCGTCCIRKTLRSFATAL